ncbi:hypothetical protein DIPPA_08379 [Diplonema papillatum]|nr:hypothetical protein DIPPA_08379 [Diplonema papillatum]
MSVTRAGSVVQRRCVGVGPPDNKLYSSFKNKHRAPWFHFYTGDFSKETEEDRWAEMRKRLAKKEYIPVNTTYGRQARPDNEVLSEDATKLPFLRNRVASWWDVTDVVGKPELDAIPVLAPKQPPIVGTGTANVRPYAQRSKESGPACPSSNFMGSFLNSFVALDADEWDMKAVLRDIEAPRPHLLLRHLTELLEQRHMAPRRLRDAEIVELLRACKDFDPSESFHTFDLALEKHAPGMLSLAVMAKGPAAGAPERLKGYLDRLCDNGAEPTIEAANAVLAAHRKAEHTAGGVALYRAIVDGKLGVEPTTYTFNAVIRLLSAPLMASGRDTANQPAAVEEAAEAVFDVFGEMLDRRTPPDTFTLNSLVAAAGVLGGFDAAASIFDAISPSNTARLPAADPEPTGAGLQPYPYPAAAEGPEPAARVPVQGLPAEGPPKISQYSAVDGLRSHAREELENSPEIVIERVPSREYPDQGKLILPEGTEIPVHSMPAEGPPKISQYSDVDGLRKHARAALENSPEIFVERAPARENPEQGKLILPEGTEIPVHSMPAEGPPKISQYSAVEGLRKHARAELEKGAIDDVFDIAYVAYVEKTRQPRPLLAKTQIPPNLRNLQVSRRRSTRTKASSSYKKEPRSPSTACRLKAPRRSVSIQLPTACGNTRGCRCKRTRKLPWSVSRPRNART